MRTLLVVWIAAILAATVFPLPVYGQDRTVPPCNSQEKTLLHDILPDYMNRYTDISNRIGPIDLDEFGTDAENVEELIADMHDLQIEWWQYVVPDLPQCLLAVEISHTAGRLFDETLIALLLLDADFNSFADWHADPILELSAELAGLLNQLNGPVAFAPQRMRHE